MTTPAHSQEQPKEAALANRTAGRIRCQQCSELIEAPEGCEKSSFPCPKCDSLVTIPLLCARSGYRRLEERKKRRGGGLRRFAVLMGFGFFGIIMVIGMAGVVRGYNYWLLPLGLVGMFGSLYASERRKSGRRRESLGEVLTDMGDGNTPPGKGIRAQRTQANLRARLEVADAGRGTGVSREPEVAPVAKAVDESAEVGVSQAVVGGTPKPEGSGPVDAADSTASMPRSHAAVYRELQGMSTSKRGLPRKIITFLVSLALFVWLGVGFFDDTIVGLAILIGVILFHELGHYVAMRTLGYRDVSIFFIPMLGAGTSGKELGTPGWKRGLAVLMGPVPGILLGALLGVVYLITKNGLLGEISLTLVALNALNLLPVFPLDGGRLLYEVLLCRNRHFDFAVKVISGSLLGLIALASGEWFLGGLAFFVLIGALAFLKEEGIVAKLKPEIAIQRENIPDVPPRPIVSKILSEVGAGRDSREKQSPKALAGRVDGIWRRLHTQPPGVAGTLLCLAVYGVSFFIVLIIPVVALAGAPRDSKIVEFTRKDGTTGYREIIQFAGKRISEVEVSPDGLYHGKGVSYLPFTDTVTQRGEWHRGKWHGEWKTIDAEGRVTSITLFDKGRFLLLKEKTPNGWLEKKRRDLPSMQRQVFDTHEKAPPEGPRNWRDRKKTLAGKQRDPAP